MCSTASRCCAVHGESTAAELRSQQFQASDRDFKSESDAAHLGLSLRLALGCRSLDLYTMNVSGVLEAVIAGLFSSLGGEDFTLRFCFQGRVSECEEQ